MQPNKPTAVSGWAPERGHVTLPLRSQRECLPMNHARLLCMLGTASIGLTALDSRLVAVNRQKPATDEKDRVLRVFLDEFVTLTPGKGRFPASFRMGSAEKDAPSSEKPAHTVTFERSFAVAKFEVTQELYETVTGRNPSRWKGRGNSVER